MSKPHFVICHYDHHLGLIWPRHTAGIGESSPISDVVRLLELVLTEAKVSFETIDCRERKSAPNTTDPNDPHIHVVHQRKGVKLDGTPCEYCATKEKA